MQMARIKRDKKVKGAMGKLMKEEKTIFYPKS